MDTNGMESLFTAWVLSMVMASVLAAPFIIAMGYMASARGLLPASGERGLRGASLAGAGLTRTASG
ncbi:MAG: hypothetical protein LBE06_05265 [Azoarcus sp.]|nr:hypothetical protein [Azoarcus sp.]